MEDSSENPHQSSAKESDRKTNRSSCLSRWWNQNFPHQKRLGALLEHPLFHLLITLLVVVECASVIIELLLHSVKGQYQCNSVANVSSHSSEEDVHRVEYGMEICDYTSFSILAIFLFEILLKIYALGYHYWNWKENHKLDYFDAILVIVSFSVEIYFLIVDKESVLTHSALLIVALRLWHIVRIANASVRCFQKGEEFKAHRREDRSKKSPVALVIPSSIQTLLDLMQEKTECLRQDVSIEQLLVDRFEDIDQKCQDAFENYYEDETKLLEEIEKLHLIAKRI